MGSTASKYLGYLILLGGIIAVGIVAFNSPAWARNTLLIGGGAILVGHFWVAHISGAAGQAAVMTPGK